MRTPSSALSHFRFPLDTALGTPGAVRLLRALSRQGRPLASGELARLTHLNISGLRRTLSMLIDAGLVGATGGQRGATYQLNLNHPLIASLSALYAAEEQRADRVLEAVRAAASRLHPLPQAVWLYGSVARGDDTPISDLDVVLVCIDDRDVERTVDAMHRALLPTEDVELVSVSVIGISAADVLRLSAGDPWWTTMRADAIPILGPSPDVMRQRLASGTATGSRRSRVRKVSES